MIDGCNGSSASGGSIVISSGVGADPVGSGNGSGGTFSVLAGDSSGESGGAASIIAGSSLTSGGGSLSLALGSGSTSGDALTIDGGDGSSASGKREQALQQDGAAVCQVFLLELPRVPSRGVESRDELMAGEPVLLVLVTSAVVVGMAGMTGTMVRVKPEGNKKACEIYTYSDRRWRRSGACPRWGSSS